MHQIGISCVICIIVMAIMHTDLDQQLAEDPRLLDKYLSPDKSSSRGHSKKITIKSSILPDGVSW